MRPALVCGCARYPISSRSAITLRIVAGERCGKWRLDSAREPTGSAESTYSRISAMSTSRCRASICLILQQVDKQRVRDEESRLGQARAVVIEGEVSGPLPLLDPPEQHRVAGH